MPVENVFKPKTIKEIDPKAAAEKDGQGADYWTKKASEAKARLDYQEYLQAMQMLGQPPDPAFKVSGEVKLGNIDIQEQQRQAQEKSDKLVQGKDDELKTERQRANTAEENLQAERIASLRTDFTNQMAELNKTIERLGTAPKKDERPIHEQFKEQLGALRELATDLGLEKTSGGRDPMVDIELAKMSYEQAREDREFKWKMRQDEKSFQLDIQKAADEREYRRAQIQSQAKKDEIFANLPEQIGGALAKGIVDSTKKGAPQHIGQPPAGPQARAIEIPEGESGTIACSQCESPIEVAATTTLAQCLGCNAQYPIHRVPAGGPQPTEEE